MPRIGGHDAFEFEYMGRLRAELGRHGLLVAYEYDRAALDLGVHLYAGPPGPDGSRRVAGGRVWVQAKGIRAATLPTDQIAASADVAVKDLPLEQVRYWYASAEPVYLVVYLEATGQFLAADVRDLVDDQRAGAAGLAVLDQDTVMLRVPIDATLDRAIARMPAHRSIRADGPAFRGRPLGHGYDPLRSELATLPPDVFTGIVDGLLAAHGFRPGDSLDCSALSERIGAVTATPGRLGLTYEWTVPLFTEYGVAPGSDWRLESPPFYAHGDVLVVVHSDPVAAPDTDNAAVRALRDARPPDTAALVFANATDLDCCGAWRAAFDDLDVMPQGLGSLAFNVLVTTTVYLDFANRLRWAHVNYL